MLIHSQNTHTPYEYEVALLFNIFKSKRHQYPFIYVLEVSHNHHQNNRNGICDDHTKEKRDWKTNLATVLQIVLESTESTGALARSESKVLIRFNWFSLVPWPLSMTDKWNGSYGNWGNHSTNLFSMYIIILSLLKKKKKPLALSWPLANGGREWQSASSCTADIHSLGDTVLTPRLRDF